MATAKAAIGFTRIRVMTTLRAIHHNCCAPFVTVVFYTPTQRTFINLCSTSKLNVFFRISNFLLFLIMECNVVCFVRCLMASDHDNSIDTTRYRDITMVSITVLVSTV